MKQIKLKNLPPKGREIKGKVYYNGDIVEMDLRQARAYITHHIGEEVKEKKTTSKQKEETKK